MQNTAKISTLFCVLPCIYYSNYFKAIFQFSEIWCEGSLRFISFQQFSSFSERSWKKLWWKLHKNTALLVKIVSDTADILIFWASSCGFWYLGDILILCPSAHSKSKYNYFWSQICTQIPSPGSGGTKYSSRPDPAMTQRNRPRACARHRSKAICSKLPMPKPRWLVKFSIVGETLRPKCET